MGLLADAAGAVADELDLEPILESSQNRLDETNLGLYLRWPAA